MVYRGVIKLYDLTFSWCIFYRGFPGIFILGRQSYLVSRLTVKLATIGFVRHSSNFPLYSISCSMLLFPPIYSLFNDSKGTILPCVNA